MSRWPDHRPLKANPICLVGPSLVTSRFSVKQTINFLFPGRISELRRVSSPRRDEMFIELAAPELLLAPEERNGRSSRVPLPETLRSAGAPVLLITGVYKHLAPLEPEHCLVAA